jgi:hypothetical protein
MATWNWEMAITDAYEENDKIYVSPSPTGGDGTVSVVCAEEGKEAAVLLTRPATLRLISALRDALDDSVGTPGA